MGMERVQSLSQSVTSEVVRRPRSVLAGAVPVAAPDPPIGSITMTLLHRH